MENDTGPARLGAFAEKRRKIIEKVIRDLRIKTSADEAMEVESKKKDAGKENEDK